MDEIAKKLFLFRTDDNFYSSNPVFRVAAFPLSFSAMVNTPLSAITKFEIPKSSTVSF